MEEGRKEDSTHTDVVREGKKTHGKHGSQEGGQHTHTQDTIREGNKEGLHGKHGRQEGGQHTYEILSKKERRKAYMENMEDRKEDITHIDVVRKG